MTTPTEDHQDHEVTCLMCAVRALKRMVATGYATPEQTITQRGR